MDNSGSDAAASLMAGTFGIVILLVYLAIIIFSMFLCWKIASKAGYPGVYSLLLLIPFVGFIVMIMFAFVEWPITRALRAATGGGGYAPPGMGGPGVGMGYAPPPPPPPYPTSPPPSGYLPPGSQPPSTGSWGSSISSPPPPPPQ